MQSHVNYLIQKILSEGFFHSVSTNRFVCPLRPAPFSSLFHLGQEMGTFPSRTWFQTLFKFSFSFFNWLKLAIQELRKNLNLVALIYSFIRVDWYVHFFFGMIAFLRCYRGLITEYTWSIAARAPILRCIDLDLNDGTSIRNVFLEIHCAKWVGFIIERNP